MMLNIGFGISNCWDNPCVMADWGELPKSWRAIPGLGWWASWHGGGCSGRNPPNGWLKQQRKTTPYKHADSKRQEVPATGKTVKEIVGSSKHCGMHPHHVGIHQQDGMLWVGSLCTPTAIRFQARLGFLFQLIDQPRPKILPIHRWFWGLKPPVN